MTRRAPALLLTLCLPLFGACSQSTTEADPSNAAACEPGRSVACTGTGGCEGGQVCREDGSGFEACLCGDDALSSEADPSSGGGTPPGQDDNGPDGPDSDVDEEADGGSDMADDAAITDGDMGDDSDPPVVQEGCEPIDAMRAQVMLVVDRSGSMGGQDWPACSGTAEPIDCDDPANAFNPVCVFAGAGGLGVDRWTPTMQALQPTLERFDAQMDLGLVTFPSDDQCAPGDVQVAVGQNNADAINAQLDGICPNGATPVGPTLDNVAAGLRTADAARPRATVLLTDGQPNCSDDTTGGDDDPMAVDAAYAAAEALRTDGVATYVVGFDTQMDASLSLVLDGIAERGATEVHVDGSDAMTIETAVDTVFSHVERCHFVSSGPTNGRTLQLDGSGVPAEDIVSLGAGNFLVRGATCDALLADASTALAWCDE